MLNNKVEQYAVDEKVLDWFLGGNVVFRASSSEEFSVLMSALRYCSDEEQSTWEVPEELLSYDFSEPLFVGVDSSLGGELRVGTGHLLSVLPWPKQGITIAPVETLLNEARLADEYAQYPPETVQLLVERMHELEQRLFIAEQLVKKHEHEKNA